MNVAVTTQPTRKPSFSDWLKTLTFYELLVGMKATLTHLLNYKPITLQYPHEKRLLPDNYRGMLALLRYDDGTEKCVGCDLCEAACPSRVIRVVSGEVPGEPTKRYSKEYYMDMTRCLSAVLPFATPDEIAQHVREQIEIFTPGGGYVFNQIHNIQADIKPENIVAMFDTAREYRYSE